MHAFTYVNYSKEKAKDAIYYSYTKEINGFAANMDENEANELSSTHNFN